MTEPQEILDQFLHDLYCQKLGRYPDPDAMQTEDRMMKKYHKKTCKQENHFLNKR